MKLSMAAELAIRGIVTLGEHFGQGPMTLDDICAQRNLPKQYLVKLFGMLTRANLVEAVRGKGGGYVLAREPKGITLLDVIEAIEGPLAVNLCQYDTSRCDQESCAIRPVWEGIQKHVRASLSTATLDQFLNGKSVSSSR